MDKEVILAVDKAMPRFNDYLLTQYPSDQVNSMADTLSTTFEEILNFLKNDARYIGWRTLTPEQRIVEELSSPHNAGAPISASEVKMIAFEFEMDGRRHESIVHLPYLVDGQIIHRGTRHGIILGLSEKDFSRSSSTLTVRVNRQPLAFWRYPNQVVDLESVSSEYRKLESIIGARIHTRMPKNSKITIIHYLVCQFGVNGMLSRFGLSESDISFTDNIGKDTDEHEYFAAKAETSKGPPGMVYMKVKKDILEDPVHRKLAANLLYIVAGKWRHVLADIYDPEKTIFLTYMGELLHANMAAAMSHNQAQTHMYSVGRFLDEMTRKRLDSFGIKVSDFWDLIQYVFIEIERILVNTVHQDLYQTRVVIIEQFLVDSFIAPRYRKVYGINMDGGGGRKTRSQDLVKILGLKSLRNIYKAHNIEPVGSSIHNGNRLLTFGMRCMRLVGNPTAAPSVHSPDARFDPSSAAVKSLAAFPGNNTITKGMINPFISIMPNGGIIEPDYAEDIGKLREFLPYF